MLAARTRQQLSATDRGGQMPSAAQKKKAGAKGGKAAARKT
jgi:hypothetical protein